MRYGLEAGIKGLICRLFVGIHIATPETFAVETHVPVREVVLHKIRDSTSGFGRFIRLVRLGNLFDKRVEFGKDPFVDLGERRMAVRAVGRTRPPVHVGIEGKEAIGVIEGAEELTAHLIHTFGIELEVLPRSRIGHHVPPNSVCSVGIECAEGIHGITQTFGHLIA